LLRLLAGLIIFCFGLDHDRSSEITARTGINYLMAIIIELGVMLAKGKMKLNKLAELVNVTPQNLSVLKSGRAKAVRFSTLDAICKVLKCNPGDILLHQTKQPEVK
jgi:putative transcriptional regulator